MTTKKINNKKTCQNLKKMCFLIKIDHPWQAYSSASKMAFKAHVRLCWSCETWFWP